MDKLRKARYAMISRCGFDTGMKKSAVFLAVLLTAAIFLGAAQSARAQLAAVDPGPYLAGYGFYPAWYQDTTGLKLELCVSQTQSANGFMCGLLAGPDFNPNLPIIFPTNWADENFWFAAEASMRVGGNDMLLVTAVEAAFGLDAGVLDGDQVSFARVRIRIDTPSTGTYIVTHPYGTKTFQVVTGGDRAINDTIDIGIGAPGTFTGALGGDIGPFLQWSSTPGGAPTPITIGDETFVGDPNVDHVVTGSPEGTNFFRVQGPGLPNACASLPGVPCVETTLFAVTGKVFDGRLPTAVTIERATYSRTPLGDSEVNIFATSTPTASVTSRDAVIGAPTTPMTPGGAGKFYSKQSYAALNPPPDFVVVRATEPAGSTRPAEVGGRVIDVVQITRAAYARDTKTLLVEATSSDKFAPLPQLRVVGLGCPTPDVPCLLVAAPGGANNTLNIQLGAVAQPPARIRVVSSQGGEDTEPVQIVPTINIAPVADNDSASTTEGLSVDINIVDGDTDLGGAIDVESIALVAESGPSKGNVVFNSPTPGWVRYTANVGASGPDTFRYTVADAAGVRSNEATVTVQINRRPIAGNDSATSQGLAVNISVLANDTDVDGNTPLSVTNLTTPLSSTGSVAGSVVLVGSTVTFTPAVNFTGDATFTYRASDSLGALSAPATVTVSVTQAQNQPPTARDDSATTRVAVPVTIAVLANDTDPEGGALTVLQPNITAPAHGTAVRQANNTIVYTPAVGYSGSDSFTYRAQDPAVRVSEPATVTITVMPETLAVTKAEVRLRGTTQADWTVQGTTDVPTGNVIVVYYYDVRQTLPTYTVVGQAVPDRRGKWKLTLAKSLILPPSGSSVAVSSTYTSSRLGPFALTRR
jgi:hypothetical protein